jgi:arylformamidase
MDHWRLSATEYRARFDAAVTFSNGGGLRADGFRVDVPGPDVTEQDVASLFIASLNLLMVDSVELHDLSVFAEPHKGTRGGPGDRPAPGSLPGRIVDLTHPIRDGLITFPGLPAPQISPHLTRAQSRSRYERGAKRVAHLEVRVHLVLADEHQAAQDQQSLRPSPGQRVAGWRAARGWP